jgi:hypothetical protein
VIRLEHQRLNVDLISIGRLTRVAVIGSLIAALVLRIALVARAESSIEPASLIAFLAALVATLALPRLGPAIVLSLTYIAPAATAAAIGSRDSSYLCIWQAALIAPIIPTALRREWCFPTAWRSPLVFWLLCIASVWPLIVLRECNFDLALLRADYIWNSGIGISPAMETIGITQSVLVLGLPLLWLDWLFGAFRTDRVDHLIRWVIAPLAVSWLLAAAVALYQGFVDMLFLNGGLFGYMGRASGTMIDANPFGVISAMWGPALFALAVESKRRRLIVPGAAALVLSWIGVWTSGSRTATVTAGIALLFLAWHAVDATRQRKKRAWVIAGSAAALIAAAFLVAVAPSTQVAGFSRLRDTLPSASIASVKTVAAEMWNRNGYGHASTAMIREFPLVGVGLGSLSTLVVDYGKASNGDWLTPDNAQNWYRHQLAQLGILGSLGWIIWLALLAAFFWRTSRSGAARRYRLDARAIMGALAGVAVVSLVGMPKANEAAALTMMVFVFWYVALVDPAGDVLSSPRVETSPRVRMRESLAARVALVVFLAGTALVGWSRLRPPLRALRFGWEYVCGFYGREPVSVPGDASFRWTDAHAVDVFPVTNRYLRLRYWVNHPDVERHPVHVRIWLQDRLVVDEMARSVAPVTDYVRAPDGQGRVMLEARVSRTWKPSDYGRPDDRILGLALEDVTFVSDPPAGATVVTDAPRSRRNR